MAKTVADELLLREIAARRVASKALAKMKPAERASVLAWLKDRKAEDFDEPKAVE